MKDEEIKAFMDKLCANPKLLTKAIEYIQVSLFIAGQESGMKEVVDYAEEYLGAVGYPPWEKQKKEWGIK